MARLAAGRAWVELGGADVAGLMLRHGWPTIVIHGEHGAGRLLTTIKKECRQMPSPANPVRRKKPRRNEQ
jgi:hypothetical protein